MLRRFTECGRHGALAVGATLLLAGCGGGAFVSPSDERSNGVTLVGERNGAVPSQVRESSSSTQARDERTYDFSRLPIDRPDIAVKTKSSELFAAALAALDVGDHETAESSLVEITRIQPELSGPWTNLGQLYLQLDQPEDARVAFEKAIRANPTNCAAFNQLGVLARREGRLADAEQSYLACIDRDPTFPAVHLNLGILYELYLGRLSQALDSYREYQALAGSDDQRVNGWVLDLERRL